VAQTKVLKLQEARIRLADAEENDKGVVEEVVEEKDKKQSTSNGEDEDK
jgi:hypothetical protein